MRAERWWQDTSIVDVLVEQPNAFEFIQANAIITSCGSSPMLKKKGIGQSNLSFIVH